MKKNMDVENLPSDIVAEKSVIGSILLDTSKIFLAVDILMPSDFYFPDNRKIFNSIIQLTKEDSAVDLVTIHNKCPDVDMKFLSDLFRFVPSSEHIEHYCKIVKEKSKMRHLLKLSENIKGMVKKEKKIDDILKIAEQNVYDLSLESRTKDYVYPKDVFPGLKEELFGPGKLQRGMMTQYKNIDNIVGLIGNSSIVTIAGPTGTGKTALMDNIAIRYSYLLKRPVWKWSGEMSSSECWLRYISLSAELDSRRARSGFFTDRERDKFLAVMKNSENLDLLVDDQGGITFDELRLKIRKVKIKHPDLGMVIIDNLPLMSMEGRDKPEQYRNTMKSIRAFSKTIGCPFFVLTQLSYGYREREKREPNKDDILYGSSIIQDSTDIWLIYDSDDEEESKFYKNIKIAKGRFSSTGKTRLRWDAVTTSFYNDDETTVPDLPEKEKEEGYFSKKYRRKNK